MILILAEGEPECTRRAVGAHQQEPAPFRGGGDLACHLKAEVPVSNVEQVNVTESYRGT